MAIIPHQKILATKLAPPLAAPKQVSRLGILNLLHETPTAKLIVLHAPAGFGKTTAMIQYRTQLKQENISAAWLTLDRGDNDPSQFLNCMASVVAQLDKKRIPDSPYITTAYNTRLNTSSLDIIARLAVYTRPFFIFFDEFEHVQELSVLELLGSIIDHLPDWGRIVIASRRLPQIKLGRLRARGQLLEVGPSQLRFSATETKAFVSQYLTLPTVDINRLHMKTEGWIVALQLAAIALERHDNPLSLIESFSGSHETITEYLAEDVLAGQTEPIRNFLLKTSILQHLTAPLCDTLLGRTDSAKILKKLESENLFLFLSSDVKDTYRYHSLFAVFLREQLAQGNHDQLIQLHQTASQWYEIQDRPVPAINHALKSQDYERTLTLLLLNAENFLDQGRMHLLMQWFTTLPEHYMNKSPLLLVFRVWATLFTAGPWSAMDALKPLESKQAETSTIGEHIRGLHLVLLSMMDQKEEAYEMGKSRPLKHASSRSFMEAMQANSMAYNTYLMGRYPEAKQLLDISRAKHPKGKGLFSWMFSEAIEGIIDLDEGRFRQAKARFRMAVNSLDTGSYTSANAFASIFYADTLYETNELTQAAQLFNFYIPMTKTIVMVDHMIIAHLRLSRIAFSNGDVDRGFEYLAELEHIGQQQEIPRVVISAKLERAKIHVLNGDKHAAQEELQRADDPVTWQRIKKMRMPAHNLNYIEISKLRWQTHFGDPTATLIQLNLAIDEASSSYRHYRALNLNLLKSLALYRRGDINTALSMLDKTLESSCKEGYLRLIIDEGQAIGHLLYQLIEYKQIDNSLHNDPLYHEYLQQLLQGYSPSIKPVDKQKSGLASLLESLTSTETRVLLLLSEGHSNKVLADKLFVSDSTVRTHLRNINQKLGSKSRTQAISIARKLGLVD